VGVHCDREIVLADVSREYFQEEQLVSLLFEGSLHDLGVDADGTYLVTGRTSNIDLFLETRLHEDELFIEN
jgi:hypothetical protein